MSHGQVTPHGPPAKILEFRPRGQDTGRCGTGTVGTDDSHDHASPGTGPRSEFPREDAPAIGPPCVILLFTGVRYSRDEATA